MTVKHGLAAALCLFLASAVANAQDAPPPVPVMPPIAAPAPRGPVGLPQDAGPHDASLIEWWYFNSHLKTESGRNIAVVGSFFRTGIGTRKGHYLIYALADLDKKTKRAYSVVDRANLELLQQFLPLAAMQNPDDPKPMELLATVQKGQLPPPHRLHPGTAAMTPSPFSISFGAENSLKQVTPDARTWKATLAADDWSVDLTLSQPERPAMLVGGEGRTGLARPDDMFYVSLTRMKSEGTLTVDGKTEKVTGDGWIDRQWGSSWVVGGNGWDWLGVQLDDGSDLIVYRIKDNRTGRILRSEATLLRADGTQVVDRGATLSSAGSWTDPRTKIAYPQTWTITLPETGHRLTATPAFPEQVIPVLGIGDAIWEGSVTITGTARDGKAVGGRGYMELVGYRAPVQNPAPADKPAARP